MRRLHVISAATSVAVLVLSAALSPAAAAAFTGGTNAWTVISAPTLFYTSGNPATAVTYLNNLNATTLGIVILVVHNSLGQTVDYAAATLNLAPGANSTAYDVIFGLPPGTYNASLFAIIPSGTAISTLSTETITI